MTDSVTKRSIKRVFVDSLIAVVAGLVMVGVGGGLAFATDVLVTDGPDVVGVKSGAAGWVLIGLAVAGIVVVIAGLAGLLASWVLALVTTAQLPDKTWFVILLVTGLVSLGLVGMVLYLAVGPDERSTDQPAQRSMAGVGR